MKVLGLTCGRKMGNSEILLREALGEVEKIGAEVEIIRLGDLTIKPCTGCEGCVRNMFIGGEGRCVQKGDHMPFLLDKIAGSDGVILGVPAYMLMPPGLLIVVLNRVLGAGKKYKQALAEKPKIAATITLGGTDWTNLVLPLTNLALERILRGNSRLVDQMLVEYIPRPAQVLLHDDAVERARKLGANVGKALRKPYSEAKYVGKEEETCPLCHNNLLRVRGSYVECPICDIKGKIEMQGRKLKVVFDEKVLEKSRYSPWGTKRHDDERKQGHDDFYAGKTVVDEKLKKYRSQKRITAPPALK